MSFASNIFTLLDPDPQFLPNESPHVCGAGWYMTETYELAVYGACDGKVLPTGCSGLAIVSRYPFHEVREQPT